METAAFRKLIDVLARRHGFTKTKASWLRDMPDILFALELQRSAYGRQYYLNIKVWLKDLLGQAYKVGEIPKDSGHIFRREAPEFSEALDLESPLTESARNVRLNALFGEFLDPLLESLSSHEGILRCANATPPRIFLLPNIREHLAS